MKATEIMKTAAELIAAEKTRSAYDTGVKVYAAELIEELAENAAQHAETITSGKREAIKTAMLNGADDWAQYSWGGCSLIYDTDIAERLCTPSELKKTRGGERRPNGREEWLDVQARALRRAACWVADAIINARKVV